MMIVEGEKLKLLDFGSAQHLTAARPAHVGKCGDFVENMAPEILDCKELVPETDIWAVGVLTFTMLSGDCPFTSDKESDKEKNIRKGKVKIGRCYTGLSQGAISFLKSTLCRNAGGRPSGSECLALPWLQEDSRAKLRHSAVSFQTSKLRSYLKQREKHRKLLCTQHKVLLPE
uniref:non-specific serine/threonine protein kinase n=1 Tax=Callorhinchus milii TaxID=7868 RepID=A0A4W3IEY5_CALMI